MKVTNPLYGYSEIFCGIPLDLFWSLCIFFFWGGGGYSLLWIMNLFDAV